MLEFFCRFSLQFQGRFFGGKPWKKLDFFSIFRENK